MATAMSVVWAAIVLWYVGRWLDGRLTPALSSTTGPPGVAGLGGAIVGAMLGNVASVRRARRPGRERAPD